MVLLDPDQKSDSAIDYSDITEVADDEDGRKARDAMDTMQPPSTGQC